MLRTFLFDEKLLCVCNLFFPVSRQRYIRLHERKAVISIKRLSDPRQSKHTRFGKQIQIYILLLQTETQYLIKICADCVETKEIQFCNFSQKIKKIKNREKLFSTNILLL